MNAYPSPDDPDAVDSLSRGVGGNSMEHFDNRQGVQDALKGCPKISASVKAVGEHPAIAKYLASRPITKV